MNGRFKNIKRIFYRVFILAMLLCVTFVKTFAGGEANEYNIKAMFILNFMKYVEWPADEENKMFRIGIVGESEIYPALLSMIADRQESKKIEIKNISKDEKGKFQIIIIPRSEIKRTDEWARKYCGKGVLIISEENKNTNSVAINLININNKIRFEINKTQAKLDGVKISSKLASLAASVQP